jgi:3-oxoacyl-[acyl-carrier-protein] synthase II
MTAGLVSMHWGFRGPIACPVGACASGAQALGAALRMIERGDADVVVAGGTEAAILPLVVAGFAAMRALSTRSDDPPRASRPFDTDRDGFVLGEGAGVLVLEAEHFAAARGARVRARCLGYGEAADASHPASPPEDAHGAKLAIERALADAGLAPRDVDHVNAHATSTPAGDRSEALALRAVFGAHADELPVSATKSTTGHLLGAAGAVEAILCVRALETELLPPTINLDRPDPDCALDHVANKARPHAARVALSNAFGFGGVNACLLLGRKE